MSGGKKGARKGGSGGRYGWIKWLFIVPILAFIVVQLYFFLQIWWWIDHNPSSTAFMREQLSVLQDKNPNATIKQTWVP